MRVPTDAEGKMALNIIRLARKIMLKVEKEDELALRRVMNVEARFERERRGRGREERRRRGMRILLGGWRGRRWGGRVEGRFARERRRSVTFMGRWRGRRWRDEW
jgi:hypothetical protein